MINFSFVLSILLMHWLFDFVCQTDSMSINKSSSWKWLSAHVAVYSIGLFIVGFNFFSVPSAIVWALFNAFLHFCVDDNTSKLSAYLWKTDKRHWFFVAVGLDQLIHYFCLLTTYYYWS